MCNIAEILRGICPSYPYANVPCPTPAAGQRSSWFTQVEYNLPWFPC